MKTLEIDDGKKPDETSSPPFNWTEEIQSAVADWTVSLLLGFLVVSFWRVSATGSKNCDVLTVECRVRGH